MNKKRSGPKRTIAMAGLDDFNRRLEERFPHVSETTLPSDEDIRAIYEFGRSYIREAADAPDGPVLAFCAVHWPNNGPALLGMTFAYNARHRKDPTTGDALFYRMWTEQEYGEVQTKEQMQQDLARYCLAHTPGPKAVF